MNATENLVPARTPVAVTLTNGDVISDMVLGAPYCGFGPIYLENQIVASSAPCSHHAHHVAKVEPR